MVCLAVVGLDFLRLGLLSLALLGFAMLCLAPAVLEPEKLAQGGLGSRPARLATSAASRKSYKPRRAASNSRI